MFDVEDVDEFPVDVVWQFIRFVRHEEVPFLWKAGVEEDEKDVTNDI